MMSTIAAGDGRYRGAAAYPRRRAAALAGAVAVTAGLGAALLLGLAPPLRGLLPDRIVQLRLLPLPKPPPEIRTPEPHHAHAAGAASAANLRAKPTPLVAPKPSIALPQPLAIAPIAGIGAQSSAGAAAVAGPGTGSGGQGNGTGSGGAGSGDGDGGSDVVQISRDLKPSDVPCYKHNECAGGTVHMRITVAVSGRVVRCIVIASAGDAELDRETCAATMQHLRFRPATNSAGLPIQTEGDADQQWGGG